MKSCTGAEPVSLMKASTMIRGFVWLWALKTGFGGLIVGLSSGFDAVASAKVIFFVLILPGSAVLLRPPLRPPWIPLASYPIDGSLASYPIDGS